MKISVIFLLHPQLSSNTAERLDGATVGRRILQQDPDVLSGRRAKYLVSLRQFVSELRGAFRYECGVHNHLESNLVPLLVTVRLIVLIRLP